MGGSGKGSSFIKRELKKTVRNTQNYGKAFQFCAAQTFLKYLRFFDAPCFASFGTAAKPFI